MKQNEITQQNKNNARLVAKSGAASKSLREARAHGEQIREALDRMRANHVRLETECDALRATVSTQSEELESARTSLGVATAAGQSWRRRSTPSCFGWLTIGRG